MNQNEPKSPINRREFFRDSVRTVAALALGGIAGLNIAKSRSDELVWQINPDKCVQCGKCADYCVLQQSAVKCFHAYDVCGYCNLCGGYYRPGVKILDTAAENQLCPTGAIKRTFVEDPYFEYTIDEKLCIGCGKCVKGCNSFGNGSLYLQVHHDICVNCNDCSIARVCPSNAFVRVPATSPYILRGKQGVEIK